MDNELYHFGILGMKWGIRRYQNADGSLTEAGKKRYLNSEESSSKKKGGYFGGTLKTQRTTTRRVSDDDKDLELKKEYISRNQKEAADRIDFYGGKRAARDAVEQEAKYAQKLNKRRTVVKDFLIGASALLSVPISSIAFDATASYETAALLLAAGPVAGLAGMTAATAACVAANEFIKSHAKEQISYIDDSSHGFDYVVAQDERQRK